MSGTSAESTPDEKPNAARIKAINELLIGLGVRRRFCS
jgi:hypothetical protein